MRRMESEELEGILSKRRGEERLDLSDLEFGDMDFRGKDLHAGGEFTRRIHEGSLYAGL